MVWLWIGILVLVQVLALDRRSAGVAAVLVLVQVLG